MECTSHLSPITALPMGDCLADSGNVYLYSQVMPHRWVLTRCLRLHLSYSYDVVMEDCEIGDDDGSSPWAIKFASLVVVSMNYVSTVQTCNCSHGCGCAIFADTRATKHILAYCKTTPTAVCESETFNQTRTSSQMRVISCTSVCLC